MSKYLQRKYSKSYKIRMREKKRQNAEQKLGPLSGAERSRRWRKRCKEAALGASTPKVEPLVSIEVDEADSMEDVVISSQEDVFYVADIPPVKMNPSSSECIKIKKEISDDGCPPGKSSHDQKIRHLFEFEDIKLEPHSPDSSSLLLQPTIKEEAEDPLQNDESMTLPPTYGKQKALVKPEIKLESDLGIWKDEPIDSNSWDPEHAQDKRKMQCNRLCKNQERATQLEVRPEIKIESNDLGIWKNDPIDSNSQEPEYAVDQNKMEYEAGNTCITEANTRNHSSFDSEQLQYMCNICITVFTHESLLNQHMLIHSEKRPYTCDSCEKGFVSKNSLMKHVSTHMGKKTYECIVCEKEFGHMSHLKQHSLIHAGEKSHECSFCGKAFVRKSNMESHMLIHTGAKPHECSLCKMAFVHASNLKRHMLIHTGGKPYECSVCKKMFTHSSNLKQHMLIHSGGKPHECSVCRKAFAKKSDMERHMLMHTRQKPHKCSTCGKAYVQSFHLKQHMVKHTGEKPYECSVCAKALTTISHVRAHMRTHSGNKPHECSVCEKTFGKKADLKQHVLIHTGEKPHKCTVCGKAFAQKSQMKTHLSIHTK